MTADNSISFVIILDPAQAHSVDLADLEDGDLDNEEEDPICHSSIGGERFAEYFVLFSFLAHYLIQFFCPAPESRSG